MEAKELRLGNYVMTRAGEVIIIDIPSIISSLYHWESVKYSKTPPFKPIPLTEEWLLKFGFKNNGGDYEIEFGRQAFIVSLAQDTDWIIVYRDDIGCRYNALIFLDHVHQLQNLIFALTGEELTIKS